MTMEHIYKDLLYSRSLNGLQHIQIINKIIHSQIFWANGIHVVSLTEALQVRRIVNYDEKNKILDFLKSEVIHALSTTDNIFPSVIHTICLDLIVSIAFDASQFQKIFEIINLVNDENNSIKDSFRFHLMHLPNVPDEIKLFL